MNYIMMVRVEKAKALPLQTDYKINDIALAVGYEDTRYFCKSFPGDRRGVPHGLPVKGEKRTGKRRERINDGKT